MRNKMKMPITPKITPPAIVSMGYTPFISWCHEEEYSASGWRIQCTIALWKMFPAFIAFNITYRLSRLTIVKSYDPVKSCIPSYCQNIFVGKISIRAFIFPTNMFALPFLILSCILSVFVPANR